MNRTEWYARLAEKLNHPGYVTLAEIREAERNMRRYLYCNNCDSLMTAEPDHTDGRPNDTYSCTECGDPILCQDCGTEWSVNHTCSTTD